MGRQPVTYYSRRGQDSVGGEIRDLAEGNTEIAAEMVREGIDTMELQLDL